MFSGTKKRIGTAASKTAPTQTRVFAILEIFCFYVSVFTLASAPFVVYTRRYDAWELTPYTLNFFKITLAGSVGFLTNYLAITMLFKPYSPQKWLVFWRQGLIPRNKKKIGKQVGQKVVSRLLDSGEIAARLSDLVERQIQTTETKREVVQEFFTFWRDHEKEIIETATPELVSAIVKLVKRNVSSERIKEIWNDVVVPRLQNEENLHFLASRVVDGIKTRVPDLVDSLRDGLCCYARDFLRQRAPFLSVGGDLLVDGLILFIDWNAIDSAIRKKMEEEETFEKIEDALEDSVLEFQRWLNSQAGRDKLEQWTRTLVENLTSKISAYLKAETPEVVNMISTSPKISEWGEQMLLSNLAPWLKNKICEKTPGVIEKINVSQIVSDAIDRQDVREFHKMIDDIAAESMGAIQVPGYFSGAAVGVLLTGIQ